MTSERMFEVLGDMDEKYIREAKETPKRNIMIFKSPLRAIASLVLLICFTGTTVLAITGKMQGFFKDIVRWDGAVIGSVYEQATEEILIDIDVVEEKLILEIEMVNPETIPYREFETFGIRGYEIVDLEENIVKTEDSAKTAEINSGTVTLSLSLDQIPAGKYRLIIREMIGSSKADQPLILNGIWVREFVIE